ncbi:MAG: SO_0444 family Cu/Zn efflux transporter [Acidobacteriota bacterium]|nr:SO_0444 family Cu/Zn efflux transporter [Acidobacteriota bacterium]
MVRQILLDMVIGFWGALAEMSPYLLLGFLVAGLLSVFVSAEIIERHLGGRSVWPVVKAALFGVPLPLCSCGVIPVAASLRRHGASRGATTSFLISTPQTGVDSILVTYSLLGPLFAIVRPLAALVSGLAGGLLVSGLLHEDGDAREGDDAAGPIECADDCCADDPGESRLLRALRYGFVTLPQDLARALLLGLVIAGVLAALVPPEFFAGSLGRGPFAMLLMLLLGVPLYVCATGSVPVAAVLLMKGISPGAVLVFLMTGPATNAATITTLWKIVGRKATMLYLATVVVSALAAGVLLNRLIGLSGEGFVEHLHTGSPGWFESICAVVLLGVLGYAIVAPRRVGSNGEAPAGEPEPVRLQVGGMTCNGCAQAVQRALSEQNGVERVQVDLDRGTAIVHGRSLEVTRLTAAVEGLGFAAELATP